jgi:hypothetical protein
MQCDKDKDNQTETVSILLRDKPLSIIQGYIVGEWDLNYAYGGIFTHKAIDQENSYMILSPDHIIIGNMYGISVDTTIVWVRAKTLFGDSTYLLSYSWSGYLWPEYRIVDQIKSDTLIIKDNGDDGFAYYYTKQEKVR